MERRILRLNAGVRDPEVTVVMPARDNAATIGDQLAALAAQADAPPWELVVVDNGSSDDTVSIVHSWEDRIGQVRVVPALERGCISYATNVGARAAVSDRVLLCDADDLVGPAWVRSLCRALDEYAIVGGRIDYRRLNSDSVMRSRTHFQVTQLPDWRGQPYAISANMGFRKEVFDSVGGFDESLCPAGFEEVVFAVAAQSAGYRIGFVPDAVVHYRFRDSLRALLRQHYGYGRGEAQAERLLLAPRRGTILRSIGQHARDLLRRVPALASTDRRWAYLGAWAYVAGYAGEAMSRRHR
jgi:GT2 family glycosyltransferase